MDMHLSGRSPQAYPARRREAQIVLLLPDVYLVSRYKFLRPKSAGAVFRTMLTEDSVQELRFARVAVGYSIPHRSSRARRS
jgi:hypothetical protein